MGLNSNAHTLFWFWSFSSGSIFVYIQASCVNGSCGVHLNTRLASSIKLVKTAELDPKKNYILGIHPHGIMCAGGYTCFSTESCGFAETFPGMRSSLAVLAGLFRLPLFREFIMSAGICTRKRALFQRAFQRANNMSRLLCLPLRQRLTPTKIIVSQCNRS